MKYADPSLVQFHVTNPLATLNTLEDSKTIEMTEKLMDMVAYERKHLEIPLRFP